MTYFVALSAVRIHGWVKRTPQLRLTRGASSALKQATSRDKITEAIKPLASDVKWCDQAGEVSGVVVLEALTSEIAEQAVEVVAKTLREALPAAEFEAWWTSADDYIRAFDAWDAGNLTGASDGSVQRRVFLPPPFDLPFVESCELCRDEPVEFASEEELREADASHDPKRPPRIGRDCRRRQDHSLRAEPPAGTEGTLAKDFDELAKRGGVGADGRRVDRPIRRSKIDNHLATISADGNAVGGLLQKLANPGADISAGFAAQVAALRQRIPLVIEDAVSEALRRAAGAISAPGQSVAPIAIHVEGGDDIVASVPAPLAWRFVRHLVEVFDDEVNKTKEALKLDAETAADEESREEIKQRLCHLSLGAGMVFAHASHPFADCLDAADDIMREAKKATRGQSAAVSWGDITEDATSRSGRWLRANEVAEQLSHPQLRPRSMTLTRSAQATLTQLLNDLWAGSPDRARIVEAHSAIRRWSKRMGITGLVSDSNSLHDSEQYAELAQLHGDLSRARWWPVEETSS